MLFQNIYINEFHLYIEHFLELLWICTNDIMEDGLL